ncbi:hypothetical protein EDEG_00677 [Edhazardia aedis USNM 41457]|uniref:Uncharacterized protein n=1 Tax=Edhazardia aedis (strain USNM 41457) TaxID=1003232 RepID=J9DV95_EDHAE|nr:hypothetical protein EDEG_00677 [Edhazardia aedis USNM 41457]|eukprot:EJW05212.1 hypothetical protein EDEG_00677 [Edhazardia aedis USNM 41457]
MRNIYEINGETIAAMNHKNSRKSFDPDYFKELNTLDIVGLSDTTVSAETEANITDFNNKNAKPQNIYEKTSTKTKYIQSKVKILTENNAQIADNSSIVDEVNFNHKADISSNNLNTYNASNHIMDVDFGSFLNQHSNMSESNISKNSIKSQDKKSFQNSLSSNNFKENKIQKSNRKIKSENEMNNINIKQHINKKRANEIERLPLDYKDDSNLSVHKKKAEKNLLWPNKKHKNEKNATNINNDNCELNISMLIKNVDDIFYLPDIKKVQTKKNNINYLIQTKSLETCIINMIKDSKIENMCTDKAFSLFVLKGSVKIIVKNLETTLKKGGLIVIEKNDIYSILTLSEHCSLYVCYSL